MSADQDKFEEQIRLEEQWDISEYLATQIAGNESPHALLALLGKQLATITNAEQTTRNAHDEYMKRKGVLEESQRGFDAIRAKIVTLLPELLTGFGGEPDETVTIGPNGLVVVPNLPEVGR